MANTDIPPIIVRAEDLKRGDKIFQIPNELVITSVDHRSDGTIAVYINSMFEQRVEREAQFQIVRQPSGQPLSILQHGDLFWDGKRWTEHRLSARRYTATERGNIHGLGLPMDGIWVEDKS